MMKKKDNGTHLNSDALVTLTARQTSILVASLSLAIGSTFLTGYFWGKRSVVLQFSQKVEQDSFADQVYASLCALYDYEPGEIEEKVASNEATPITVDQEIVPVDQIEMSQQLPTELPATQITENSCDEPVENISADQQETLSQCYAELVGFGAERSATLFASKLLQKGYEVEVKARSSITANHKRIAWYQVITQPYKDKDALQEVVDRIAQEEKLKGIRIVFI